MESAAKTSPADDLRPMVGRPVSNRGAWIFGGVLVLAAIALFSALEARRTAVTVSAISPRPDSAAAGMIASPPPLAVPDALPGEAGYVIGGAGIPPAATVPNLVPQVMPGVPRGPRVAQQGSIPGPPINPAPNYYGPAIPAAPYAPPPAQPQPAAPATADSAPAASSGQLAGSRVSATRFANPAFTVAQGTLIPAVLETALDSNRPGFVRAIVSRDVRSFDGSRVLIPRGSRLFGEYKSDMSQGQQRVFVLWLKLTRPDGVQIALESPAADPLGRAGVGGKVNTHFLARFGNALLQSSLDLGTGLLSRSAGGGTVVLGLPGSTQTLIQPNPEAYKPTVTVKHGTSVSVFVARDLDFSTVE